MRTDHQERVFQSLHQQRNRLLKERIDHLETRPPESEKLPEEWFEKLKNLDTALEKNKFMIVELQDL